MPLPISRDDGARRYASRFAGWPALTSTGTSISTARPISSSCR